MDEDAILVWKKTTNKKAFLSMMPKERTVRKRWMDWTDFKMQTSFEKKKQIKRK